MQATGFVFDERYVKQIYEELRGGFRMEFFAVRSIAGALCLQACNNGT